VLGVAVLGSVFSAAGGLGSPGQFSTGLTAALTVSAAILAASALVILLATDDLDGTFERLQASDAEVVQEPTDQPYGVRDCAFRDPAGNLVRIQELR